MRFKTDLDCSSFKDNKKINFSMFNNDVTSWCKDGNGYIVTLPFSQNNIVRKYYNHNELKVYYSWGKNKIFEFTKDEKEMEREWIIKQCEECEKHSKYQRDLSKERDLNKDVGVNMVN